MSKNSLQNAPGIKAGKEGKFQQFSFTGGWFNTENGVISSIVLKK